LFAVIDGTVKFESLKTVKRVHVLPLPELAVPELPVSEQVN
jgi:hypothetical protein